MAGGRQLEFDKQKALDAAMHVFWKKGFVGASLTELTSSMGINKPSMYATFGNKEQLFILSTEHYIENYAKPHVKFLHENNPLKQRLKNYLMSAITAQCNADGGKGCYLSLCISEASGGAFPDEAMAVVSKSRDFLELYLKNYFRDEITAGNLSEKKDPLALARFMAALLHGTAAMARGGKSVNELESIVDTAISALDV